VSEYLNTIYRPDCDYVHGEVQERNVGEKPHATVQGVLYSIFLANRKNWGVRPFTEQRVQISPENYRVADLCVVRLGDPGDAIVTNPPLICVEILSRDQGLADLKERVADYVSIGVRNVWVIDPRRHRAWTADANGFRELAAEGFSVSGTPISIPLTQIYEELDELAAGR
jgi:Uma2 family endonuclease